MTIPYSAIIDGATFRADMQNTDRVLQGEWITLANEAVRSAWNQASAARPDFQFSSADFTLISGGSASVDVTTFKDFHSLIDVVFGPDTLQEYSLGPYAWQNRRSPGGWWPPFMVNGVGPGATRASLRGNLIFCEPSLRAAGAYRAWYCPRAHVAVQIARLATTGALPSCVAAGSGVGKTLTASGNGALSVDSQTVIVNDLVLVKNQAASADNGVYTVTAAGSVGSTFILTRTPGYDSTVGIGLGDIIGVGQTNQTEPTGVVNEGLFFTVTTFTAIESSMLFTQGAAIDPILEPFIEFLQLKTAIPAMMRDGGAATTAVNDFLKRTDGPNLDGNGGLAGEMKKYFAMVRTVSVQKMIDTDAMGARGWNGSGW